MGICDKIKYYHGFVTRATMTHRNCHNGVVWHILSVMVTKFFNSGELVRYNKRSNIITFWEVLKAQL